MADEKIIFSMNGVGKVLPHNNKVILKDIYLSFFYGAKIGIIGLNGSGKSATAWATWSRNRRWTRPKPCWKWSRKGFRR